MSTLVLSTGSATSRLLRAVARRRRVTAVGRLFHHVLLGLATVYLLLFVASRVLGLLPDWFHPPTLLVLPAVALLVGLALHHRPTKAEAARLVDTRADAKDLFLTATLLDSAPGEYKPLVLEQAEARAPTVEPRQVVPYRWQGGGRNVAAALAILLLGVRFTPQLDPFGLGKQRKEREEKRRLLAEERKATRLRTAAIKRTKPGEKTSEQTRKAIDELTQTFRRMEPKDKQGNLRRLAEVQKELGELWRKRGEQRLKDALSRSRTGQTVGAKQGQQFDRWKRQLKRGDPSGLKKELDDIRKQVGDLAREADSAGKRRQMDELRRRLKGMKDFLASNATSKPLDESLRRALEQLTMAQDKKLSQEALKDALKSLELSSLELDAMAQAIRDLDALEQALNASQLAKQLNQLKALDGAATEGLKSLQDYEEFYKKLLAERGDCPIHGPG